MNQLDKLDRCEFVYNGQEALVKYSEFIEQNTPVSHILTDFMMPRLNGVQTVHRIKDLISKHNQYREVKIELPRFVFLTAYKSSQLDKQI